MPLFKSGDKAHFMRRRKTKHGYEFSTVHVVVTGYSLKSKLIAKIKYRNGRPGRVHEGRLRPEKEITQLNEALNIKS